MTAATPPFTSLIVTVVPDDDDDALCIFPAAIVSGTSADTVLVKGRTVYVRASVWARVKPELESLTTLRLQ
jgi:hypothetical protein